MCFLLAFFALLPVLIIMASEMTHKSLIVDIRNAMGIGSVSGFAFALRSYAGSFVVLLTILTTVIRMNFKVASLVSYIVLGFFSIAGIFSSFVMLAKIYIAYANSWTSLGVWLEKSHIIYM